MTKLIVKSKLCTGCKICAMTCSFVKEGTVNTGKSRIHISHAVFTRPEITYCTQCRDCIRECPEDALKLDPRSGAITLESDLCSGCGLCFEACTTGYLRGHPLTGRPLICDLCGGTPECAINCPAGAIQAEGGELSNG